MRRFHMFLVALLLALAAPLPASAQDAASIYGTFDSLMGTPDQRDFYALPRDQYWRAGAAQTITLAGGRELGLSNALNALAADFTEATGVEIKVKARKQAALPDRLDLNAVTVIIADRKAGAAMASELGIGEEMRQRFGDGRWPALFYFRRDDLSGRGARAGVVIVAADLKTAAMEPFLGLSLVWALGGASVGEELDILQKPGGRPGLTERGKQVFRLMYHPDLQSRADLAETRARARGILGLPQ